MGPMGICLFVYIMYIHFFIPAGEGPKTISLPGGPKWCKDGSACVKGVCQVDVDKHLVFRLVKDSYQFHH